MPTPEAVRLMHKARTMRSPTQFVYADKEIAKEIDRFAAQRGAEATLKGRGPHDYDGMVCKNCGERYGRLISTWCQKYPGAPPQTGGGDAEWVCAVLYRVTEHLAKTGAFAEDDIAALREALAMLDALHKGPKGMRTGGGDAGKRARALANEMARHIIGESDPTGAEEACQRCVHIVEAALRSSHREGWIAGRDASAMAVMAPVYRGGHDPVVAIRALPIPGSKTDAG